MKATSFRLPDATMEQLRMLAARLEITLTQVVVLAIDTLIKDYLFEPRR